MFQLVNSGNWGRFPRRRILPQFCPQNDVAVLRNSRREVLPELWMNMADFQMVERSQRESLLPGDGAVVILKFGIVIVKHLITVRGVTSYSLHEQAF